jgi:hypothetical protein
MEWTTLIWSSDQTDVPGSDRSLIGKFESLASKAAEVNKVDEASKEARRGC